MRRSLIDLKNDKNGLKTIFHIIIALLIFVLSQLVGGVIVDIIYLTTRLNLRILFVILRCIFEIGLFYLFLHIYISKVLKLKMSYFRITKPRFSLLWTTIAIMLPSFVIFIILSLLTGQ